MAETAEAEPPRADPQVRSGRQGFGEWLTRRAALQKARSQLRECRPEVRDLVWRARSAAELGDRMFDAYEPLSTSRGYDFAADLYRQSSYWSLCALREEPADGSLAELWRTATMIEELELPAEPEARERLEQLFVGADFRTLAALPEADQQRSASDLRSLAHSALLVSEPAERAVRELLFERVVRLGGFIGLLVALGVISVTSLLASSSPLNLAEGRPWKTSSVWAECNPLQHACGGLKTDVFFHTNEDDSPWIEFDLGTPQKVSEVYVENRSDAAGERAVPLLVEVSNDGKKWKPAARRDGPFQAWNAEFATRRVRYVRLRVDRRSYLHLEAVEIRP